MLSDRNTSKKNDKEKTEQCCITWSLFQGERSKKRLVCGGGGKKVLSSSSSLLFVTALLSGVVVLAQCADVHRQSGGHSAKIGWQRGGLDRGDVGACCKPNRGKCVREITFCVCFARPTPVFSLFFANFRQCCEMRSLATLKTTAQIFKGVQLTCQLCLACHFCSLCVRGSVFFFCGHFFYAPLPCWRCCIALVTTLHTGGITVQMLG